MTRRTSLILCGLAALVGTPPAMAAATRGPISAMVVDGNDGRVLYAENAEIRRRPASLTKMMTLFLAFDALDSGRLKLTDTIRMSRHAASQKPSKLGAPAGSGLTVDEAIRAISVISANDVAVALAEAIGGTEDQFARMMTAKAKQLGMADTSFTNVTGLPGANLTTAHDIARLSLALLRQHPDRYAYFNTRSFSWGSRRVINHNHLLGQFAGADGIKTGYTAEAGFSLAASAKRGDRRIVAVVIGDSSVQARDRRVAQLLENGFAARPGLVLSLGDPEDEQPEARWER